MAADPVRFEMTEQAQRVVAKLIKANAMPALRKQISEATAPILPAMRAEVKQSPSQFKATTEKGGSLRAAVAAAMKRSIRLSRRTVSVSIQNVPHGGKSNLARVFEGELPWEHPTFGHAPRVTQPSHPFFFRTVEKFGPAIEAKVRTVLSTFEREL